MNTVEGKCVKKNFFNLYENLGGKHKMQNMTIRTAAKAAGVYLWQIADALGKSEPTLTRYLRHELDEKEQERMLQIIEKIKAEQDEDIEEWEREQEEAQNNAADAVNKAARCEQKYGFDYT